MQDGLDSGSREGEGQIDNRAIQKRNSEGNVRSASARTHGKRRYAVRARSTFFGLISEFVAFFPPLHYLRRLQLHIYQELVREALLLPETQ